MKCSYNSQSFTIQLIQALSQTQQNVSEHQTEKCFWATRMSTIYQGLQKGHTDVQIISEIQQINIIENIGTNNILLIFTLNTGLDTVYVNIHGGYTNLATERTWTSYSLSETFFNSWIYATYLVIYCT